ncbi:MAG: leucine-rich repeat protein [Verrucomicrobiia bacterium]
MKIQIKNLFLLTALITGLGLFLESSAQAQFQWSQRIASSTTLPNGEPDLGMCLDTNGNCYVTGWFDGTNSFGGVTLTNKSVGGTDIFVAKYNTTGALQWAQRAGGSPGNLNNGRGIGVDTNGNVYFAGCVYGPADFGGINLPASSTEIFFLAKYDSAGTVQWVQQGIGGNDVNGNGLAVDSAGNSYALVFADNGDTISFGSTNVTTPSDFDENYDASMILVKYDNTGAVKWAQVMGGYGETYACKVTVDTIGNVYVSGEFDENVTIGTSNLVVSPLGATKNMFLAKFNSSGLLIWVQHPIGGNPGGGDGGLAVDQAGNIYVPNFISSPINFGGISLTNTATYNACLAKYNSSGVIQWARLAGGTNLNVYNVYFDNALDSAGNVYAGGGLSSGAGGNNGFPVAVVSKYNPTGTLQWTYSANGQPASPLSSAVCRSAVNSAGNCFLAGLYQTTTTLGTNTLQPQEAWNFFLAVTVTNPTVQFSANPVSGTPPLTVQFNSTNIDSLGNAITSWNWNFGDGSTSTLQNPSHSYTNAAAFYPSFVATNSSGVAVIGFGPLITATNISAANPTIQFTASPANGLPPLAVQFNSDDVDSLSNAITSWNWNFGDGSTSTLQNPLHTYTIANIFLPSLTATNSMGGAVIGYGPQIATLTPTPSTCFSYTTNNGAITITLYSCSGSTVNIPSTINGLPVTVIGAAFENNNNVTNVTIPDSVTSIGNHAFDSCYSLTSVTIPNSVTSIGEWAFSDCQLTSVTIPNTVTSIGEGAFNGCPLTSVTIPNSVTNIEDEVFWGCALTSVTIPNSVTSIGSSAFESCYNLTNITIPSSVTSIGNSAFADCTGLEAAYFQGNAPSADSTVFSGDPGTVYYFGGTIGWYSPFGGMPAVQLNSLFVQYTATPTNGIVPLTVHFTSPGIDNSNNIITSWNWTFGDGSTSTAQNPSHVYISAGIFQPSLVATNGLGLAVSGSGPTITPSLPTVTFTANPTSGIIPLSVQFTSPGVDSGGNAITRWNWTFGDGSTSTAQNPSHIYISASTFQPSLVATNSLGVTVSGSGPAITVGAAGNIVSNGGFETGSFSGWTTGGNFAYTSVNTGSVYAHSGTYGAQLGPSGSLGYLSQTLATAAGKSYLISFWLDSSNGLTPNEFLVSWNGTTLLDQMNLGAIGWTNIQFVVTATGAGTVLQFGFRDDPNYLGLDDISVVASQPGTLAVTTTSLPNGTNRFAYSQQLSAVNGQLPYSWSLISGSLPPGLTLATNGVISGMPTTNGMFNFTVNVIDSLSATATQALSLTISLSQPTSLGDSDFSVPALPSGTFLRYNPPTGSGQPWTFAGSSGVANDLGAPCSSFSVSNPTYAGQYAFIQLAGGQNGSISQVVNFASTGTYSISFLAAGRVSCSAGSGGDLNYIVKVAPYAGGLSALNVTNASISNQAFTNITYQFIIPSPGNYIISFTSLSGFGPYADNTVIIDDVSLTMIASAPMFLFAQLTNGQFMFTWSAVSNGVYQLQYKTNLVQANWMNIGSTVTASNTVMSITNSINTDKQRFYRVQQK